MRQSQKKAEQGTQTGTWIWDHPSCQYFHAKADLCWVLFAYSTEKHLTASDLATPQLSITTGGHGSLDMSEALNQAAGLPLMAPQSPASACPSRAHDHTQSLWDQSRRPIHPFHIRGLGSLHCVSSTNRLGSYFHGNSCNWSSSVSWVLPVWCPWSIITTIIITISVQCQGPSDVLDTVWASHLCYYVASLWSYPKC